MKRAFVLILICLQVLGCASAKVHAPPEKHAESHYQCEEVNNDSACEDKRRVQEETIIDNYIIKPVEKTGEMTVFVVGMTLMLVLYLTMCPFTRAGMCES